MSRTSPPRLAALSNLLWDIYSSGTRENAVNRSADTTRIIRMKEDAFDILVRTVHSSGVSYEGMGGSSTNVAIGFASLGGDAEVAGPLSDGSHGDRVEGELSRRGVRLMKFVPPPARDGYCVCFPESSGERSFSVQLPLYADGAAITSPPDDWPAGGFLVTTAYELNDSAVRTFVTRSMARAASRGTALVFDCGDSAFVGRHVETVWEIIRLGLDVLVMDDASRSVLLDSAAAPPPCDESHDPFAASVRYVLSGRGTHGADIHSGGTKSSYAAHDAAVVDTTGAGDALLAGFLWGLSSGCGAKRSMELGLAAAAETVGTLGPHLPPGQWRAIRLRWEGGATPDRF